MEYLYLGHLKELMASAGLRPDRGLGQNFLINTGIVEAIVEAGDSVTTAIEIGAGPGILTLPLSHRYPRVIAVEIDERIIGVLREVVADRPGVDIVVADARIVDWREVLESSGAPAPVTWFGNLPYYAAAPILNRVLESSVPWRRGVFMFQREVADRLTAPPGGKDYGVFTLAVRYHAEVRVLKKVSPGSFYPSPEVASSVVILTPRPEPLGVPFDPFVAVVRAGFAQRRKTLRNSLLGSGELPLSRDEVDDLLDRADIDPGRRGETLSMEEFATIARFMVARDP